MRNKNLFIGSIIVMMIALICMVINWFVMPFPDVTVRIIGVLMLINLIVMTYSAMKLRSNRI